MYKWWKEGGNGKKRLWWALDGLDSKLPAAGVSSLFDVAGGDLLQASRVLQ